MSRLPMDPHNSPSAQYPRSGDIIDGKYRCDRVLGVGGMGAVVKAEHLLRQAPVALKFMNPQAAGTEGAVERFVNEAIAASRIDSEHVVKIFDVGQLPGGSPFLVMEYLEGQDLSELAARQPGGRIESVPRSVHFILQILRGLQVAHEAGIVHRDMKPSNCFITTRDGDADFVKLLDFGISKLQKQGEVSLTRTNSILGTPLYMAPEQARNAKSADIRTDLYATGVILYELLSSRNPYESDTFTALLVNICTGQAPPLASLRPDLPPELCAIVHKAFARDPDARFQSAVAMLDALVPWADERSHVVIGAVQRRAGRHPSTMPSAPPLTGIAAASARPPPPDTVPGLTAFETTAPAPRPQASAAGKPAMATLMIVAGTAVAVLTAGVLLWHLRSESPLSTPVPAASADVALSPVESVPSQPAAAVSSAPQAPVVVVLDPEPAPSAAAVKPPSTRNSPSGSVPTASAVAPTPGGGAKKPRLGDITIQE